MRNVIVLFVVMILIGFGVYLIGAPNNNIDKQSNDLVSVNEVKNKLAWGVGFDPHPNGIHQDKYLLEHLDKVKDLDLDIVRVEVPQWTDKPYEYLDPVVDRLIAEGIEVVIAFQPNKAFEEYEKNDDLRNDSYHRAYDIAKHYSQKNIRYFQMGNEVATGSVKPGWPGRDDRSYIPEKYNMIYAWLDGASSAISDVDRNFKKIITGHWLHYGFFDKLNRDGLEYDIIGWDWHQESPYLVDIESDGMKINLIDELEKLGKELWITEGNSLYGSYYGESYQAQYLDKMINHIIDSGKFSTFMFLSIYDGIPKPNDPKDSVLGLRKMNKTDGVLELGEAKEVYDLVKSIINKNKNEKN
jgi:hypothetical protein